MKTGIQLTLLGIAALIIFLLISAPAAILTRTIQHYTPAKFQSVSGTLWNGAAANLNLPGISIGPIAWRIKPLALLRGTLAIQLQLGANNAYSDIRGNLSAKSSLFGDVELQQTRLEANADWVFTQAAIPVAATGIFQLDIENLQINMNSNTLPHLKGMARWENAAVTYPQTYDLGVYQILLSSETGETGEPELLNGIISDINSPLKIDGTVTLDKSHRYSLDINIQATDTAPGDLKRVIPLLGNPNNDGAVNIKRQGSLADL